MEIVAQSETFQVVEGVIKDCVRVGTTKTEGIDRASSDALSRPFDGLGRNLATTSDL
jgi:hypothetical protein